MDSTALDVHSKKEAQQAFEICTQSLQHAMDCLKIPVPHYVKVSGIFVPLYYLFGLDPSLVRRSHQEDISALVEGTRDIVKERLKGDAEAGNLKAQGCRCRMITGSVFLISLSIPILITR